MSKKEMPHQQFEKLKQQKFDDLIKDYKTKIDKTRDAISRHNKYWNEANAAYQTLQQKHSKNSRFIIDINEELEDDKTKNFASEFDKEFVLVKDKNKTELLEILAELAANSEFMNKLGGYKRSEAANKKIEEKSIVANFNNIQWNKNNVTEFTQLIYALYEAGYLSNKEDERTKLVEDVAKIFNVKLTKSWQSNLSKSIHKSNNDYESKIFDKLKKSYMKYAENLLTKHKKN